MTRTELLPAFQPLLRAAVLLRSAASRADDAVPEPLLRDIGESLREACRVFEAAGGKL